MAPLSKNIKIIIAVIVVVVLGYIVYSFMSKPPAEEVAGPGGLSSQSVQNTSEIGKKLAATLETIRSIRLDRSIIENPVFMSLEDFSTEISPLPVGRDNPFEPVRSSASASVATPARR